MFDPVKTFQVSITSGGIKTCEVRWPTDSQWAQRARETKVIRRVLGGGRTQRERTTSTEADVAVFDAVHVTGGENFDDYEKSAVIAKLDRAEIVEVRRRGDVFRITLKVAKGQEVHHLLKIPSKRQAFAYENQAVNVVDRRRTLEMQMFLEPAETLWGHITDGVEGYAPGASVPINHKEAAVAELLAVIAEQEDDVDPEA